MNDVAKTGGAFLRQESVEENLRKRREEKAAQKRAEARRKAAYWSALVLCDMALIAMILQNLIDQRIGMAVLAVAGCALARQTK